MTKTKSALLFLLAIALFGAVAWFTFRDVNLVRLFVNVSVLDLVLNLAFGALFFVSTGYVMRLIYSHHYGLEYEFSDVILLPFLMHLWTYILPIKGGFIYHTFFMKTKYEVDLSKGFSVGILVFVISLAITCIGGGFLSLLLINVIELQLTLALLTVVLLTSWVIGVRYEQSAKRNNGYSGVMGRLILFVINTSTQISAQLSDWRLVWKLTIITVVSTAIHALWFYHTTWILGFEANLFGVILATLVLRIVMLIRFLPGNLGVQEVMIGSVFLAAGLGLEEGLATSLMVRFNSMTLAATLGGCGTYLNLKTTGINSFTSLYNQLRKST